MKRTMSAEGYGQAVRQLGMSVAASARFLGVSQRQAYRMAHGQAPVPTSIAMLLNGMIERNEKPVVPKRMPGTY